MLICCYPYFLPINISLKKGETETFTILDKDGKIIETIELNDKVLGNEFKRNVLVGVLMLIIFLMLIFLFKKSLYKNFIQKFHLNKFF